MPSYNFVCLTCQKLTVKQLSIPAFLKIKKENQEIKCENCLMGVLSHRIETVSSAVEKSPDQLAMETKEEIRKIVKKIEDGDTQAIADIYGERPNPYKK